MGKRNITKKWRNIMELNDAVLYKLKISPKII